MARKIKVIMVDDEVDLCSLVKENLSEEGEFEVLTISDPTEAVAFCRKEKPDVILLDIVMPKIKGTEIVKMLKGFPETKDIPVIVISGLGEIVYFRKKGKWQWLPNRPVVLNRGEVIHEKDPDRAAHAYGVEGYITKPFTTENLMEIIREVVKSRMVIGDEENESS